MATDTIPADLPPMVEFKAHADKIIKERWGVQVEHIRSSCTYEQRFYHKRGNRTKYSPGENRGWPHMKGAWCQSDIKMPPLKAIEKGGNIIYVGIAGDEPNRFHNLSEQKKSPLAEAGWTEADCRRWCEENDLLSPIYTTSARGGCWFCHNQSVNQLRLLRRRGAVPSQLYQALPFIITAIVLVATSIRQKGSGQPAGLGLNYFREER